MKALAALVILAGCGDCLEAQQEGPGLSGTMSYTTADGMHSEAALEQHAWMDMTAVDAVEVHGKFVDGWGHDRTYEVHVHGLAVGSPYLDGDVCLVRQSGSEPACSRVIGTVAVRQLDSECYQHESGIAGCAETIDLDVDVTSDYEGTSFTFDGTMLTVGSWVSVECAD